MATTVDKPEFVCFYMNGDNFCINFINKLKTKPDLMKKFNMVDINSIPTIPNEIEEVPAVYDGKQIYQGKPAFTWLNEKLSEFLSAANDGCMYSFIDGQEEQVFNNYSLLEQKNGSHGMGDTNGNDPARMSTVNDNTSKNRTLETLMATRNQDLPADASGKKNLNSI